MSFIAPITGAAAAADVLTVSGTSAQFANITTMAAGQSYQYVANIDTWINQGSNPTASAAAGSMFVPAKTVVVIDGALGAKLAAIQDSTGGKASLVRVRIAPVR